MKTKITRRIHLDMKSLKKQKTEKGEEYINQLGSELSVRSS